MQDDLDFHNMDNEWVTGVMRDGQGWHYTTTRQGVLWASGWIRCEGEDVARAFAWDAGKRAVELAS